MLPYYDSTKHRDTALRRLQAAIFRYNNAAVALMLSNFGEIHQSAIWRVPTNLLTNNWENVGNLRNGYREPVIDQLIPCSNWNRDRELLMNFHPNPRHYSLEFSSSVANTVVFFNKYCFVILVQNLFAPSGANLRGAIWGRVCIDEVHENVSLQNQLVQAIRATGNKTRIWYLTGTPFENSSTVMIIWINILRKDGKNFQFQTPRADGHANMIFRKNLHYAKRRSWNNSDQQTKIW